MTLRITALAASLLLANALGAQSVPRALFTDPPHDTLHPARNEVLHLPTHGVSVNGLAFIAAGAGAHPTLVFFHGLPGNEKGHDLAQAVRRAGWNVITFNYRGSWGSPGTFAFDHTLEDAAAVLGYLRDTANARTLQVDTSRIVVAGHSMGGWVAAFTASRDAGLRGAILISAADIGLVGATVPPGKEAVAFMADNMESLAGGTAERFADDLVKGAARRRMTSTAKGLARTPLLVLTSDDGLKPHSDSLVVAVRRLGNGRVTTLYTPTDHGWADRRILLAATVIRWLERLPGVERAR
jgi:pimeloyl-ACP methyl ester carboxylesterase